MEKKRRKGGGGRDRKKRARAVSNIPSKNVFLMIA